MGRRMWEMLRSAIKMSSCADETTKTQWRKRSTVASSWEWSELWTSERSDGVGERVNRLSIHSLSLSNNQGLPWKPLYVCTLITLTPYTYSLIHRDTHKKTQKDTNTHFFWTDNPLPPSLHTNAANSGPLTHSRSISVSPHIGCWGSVGGSLDWYSQQAQEVSWPRWWPAGAWSWPDCVCPPLWWEHGGLRSDAPSWASLGSSPPEAHKHFKSWFWMRHTNPSVVTGTGFGFSSGFGSASNFTHKHTVSVSRLCNAALKALLRSFEWAWFTSGPTKV